MSFGKRRRKKKRPKEKKRKNSKFLLPSNETAGTTSECGDLNTSLSPWNCFRPPFASSGLYHQTSSTSTLDASTPLTSEGLSSTAAAAAAAAVVAAAARVAEAEEE